MIYNEEVVQMLEGDRDMCEILIEQTMETYIEGHQVTRAEVVEANYRTWKAIRRDMNADFMTKMKEKCHGQSHIFVQQDEYDQIWQALDAEQRFSDEAWMKKGYKNIILHGVPIICSEEAKRTVEGK